MKKNRAVTFLVASVLLTLALYYLPFGQLLAYPLLLISTVAHELGHGLTAMLLGQHFESFKMAPDGSGLTAWAGSPGRVTTALVAAGGLIGPALVACVGFMAGRKPGTARWFVGLVGLGLLLAVLLVVRSWFAVGFVGLLGLMLAALAAKARPSVVQFALIFLCVQLSLSVFSRSDYLFTQSAGAGPSDVAQIAAALFLPYWFWGLVCGAISVGAVLVGVASVVSQE